MKHKFGKYLICLIMIFLLIPSLAIMAQEETLEIHDYINDYANLIDEDHEQELNQAGNKLEQETGAQIVFITVESLQGQDIRQVAYRTFKKYGIGHKDLDNGILFIVSMDEKQRYMEVGTGLEGTITDIASQHLQQDYLVPQFQQGNYQQGLVDLYYKTVDAIINGIDTGELQANPNIETRQDEAYYFPFTTLVILAIIIVLIMSSASNKNAAIILRPGQSYQLNVRDYDFNDESILIFSENNDIVQVKANGIIQAMMIGQTNIYLQKLGEETKKKIPVIVTRKNGSARRNDKMLEYLLWGTMLNNRSRYTSNRFRNGGFGGFSGGGFGGFSGGGGHSRGGGAGGSW